MTADGVKFVKEIENTPTGWTRPVGLEGATRWYLVAPDEIGTNGRILGVFIFTFATRDHTRVVAVGGALPTESTMIAGSVGSRPCAPRGGHYQGWIDLDFVTGEHLKKAKSRAHSVGGDGNEEKDPEVQEGFLSRPFLDARVSVIARRYPGKPIHRVSHSRSDMMQKLDFTREIRS